MYFVICTLTKGVAILNKASIDFDAVRFYGMTLEEMDEEFKKMKDYGIDAVNIEYKIFIDKEFEIFKENILACIKFNRMQIIFRSRPIDGYYTDYIDDEQYQKSLVKHKQFLYTLYNILEERDIKRGVKVIFAGGKCESGEIEKHIEKNISFFKELSSSVLDIDFEILTEVQAARPIRGRIVGDTWSDFLYMIDAIPNENWGICWSTASSRLNFVEYNETLIPDKKILDKVKLANVRNNINQNFDISIYKNEVQEQEIKALIINGYNNVFNLEYIYVHLENSNISHNDIYDGIYYLQCVLNYFRKKHEQEELYIINDIAKMNRQSIRTVLTKDIIVSIPIKSLELNEIEIATHSLKIWSEKNIVFKEDEEIQIEIKYKEDEPIILNTKYMMCREEGKFRGYVFKIIDKKPDIIKNVYKLVYLVG